MLQLADLNPKKYPTTHIIDSNLLVLFQRLKSVEDLWIRHVGIGICNGFKSNSGLRSTGHQANLIKAGLSKATDSRHLYGMADDVDDPGNLIKSWLWANTKILEDNHLWCEHPDATDGWWHAQTSPPKSGRRWFWP